MLFETTELSELYFRTAQNLALPVRIMDDAIEMEFPVYQTTSAEVPPRLLSALGLTEVEDIAFNAETNILLLEISSTAVLKKLLPDFPALQRAHDSINGVLVTAPSVDDGFDFHSRYFWPWSGTNEDPVTGGTHTFLAPYWSERLGKSKLRSFQSSARSGSMEIEVLGDTMRIRSQAVVVFEGRLRLGEP